MDEKIHKKTEEFFTQFQPRMYRKGTIIIHPEEQPEGAFYIKGGYVREYNISVDGVEITIHLFAPRAFFPMTWVISDIKNRYYFEALTVVGLYSAPKDAVNLFLKDNPDVLYSLTKRLLNGLDKLSIRIEQLAHGKAHTRMVSSLLFLARHFGKTDDKKVTITEKFTHREIAAFAAMTRETASREWEKMRHEGLIDHTSQHIVIPDIDKLQQELNSA